MSIREYLTSDGTFVNTDIQCDNLQVTNINGEPYVGGSASSGGMQSLLTYFAQTQSISASSQTSIIWSTIDNVNSFGTSSIQIHSDLASHATQFINSSSSPIAVNVSGFINCSAVSNSVYVVFVTRNGVSTDRLCASEIMATSDYMNIPFTFNAVMHVNDYFQVNIWTSGNVNTNAFGLGSKIAIAQYVEGNGDAPAVEWSLTDVLEIGSDAGQNPITNLSTLSSNNLNVVGATGYVNFLYNGSTAGIFHQIAGASNQLSIKQFNGASLLGNVFSCNSDGSVTTSTNGVLKIKNGTTLGRVYDDTIYPPPSGGGTGSTFSPCTIGYYNSGTAQEQQILSNVAAAVIWYTPDTVNTVGNIGLTFDGVRQFTNPNSLNTKMILNVSGFVSWDAPTTAGCNRALWAIKNGVQADQYGLTSTPTTANNSTIQSFSFNIVLNAGDRMILFCLTNDTDLSLLHQDGSRIIITRLL